MPRHGRGSQTAAPLVSRSRPLISRLPQFVEPLFRSPAPLRFVRLELDLTRRPEPTSRMRIPSVAATITHLRRRTRVVAALACLAAPARAGHAQSAPPLELTRLVGTI